MAENKTKPTGASVTEFIARIPDAAKQQDCRTLVRIMRKISGSPPKMWGPGIVGFGSYRYKYASGREGDMCLIGFAPRKQDLTLYIMPGSGSYKGLLSRLGKHKTSKACLYIKRLADVDTVVLETIVAAAFEEMSQRNAGACGE